MPVCAFTGFDEPYVRAHLIPKSFYRLDGKNRHIVFPTGANGYLSRTGTGLYDASLVGETAERFFATLDTYAFDVLEQRRSVRVLEAYGHAFRDERGGFVGGALEEADGEKLVRFALSVFWRCSASKRNEVKSSSIGRYENSIKNDLLSALWGKNKKLSKYYDIVLISEETDSTLGAIFPPFLRRFDGVNWKVFRAGRWEFALRCDNRRGPLYMTNLAIRPESTVHFVFRRFWQSKEVTQLSAAAKRALVRHSRQRSIA